MFTEENFFFFFLFLQTFKDESRASAAKIINRKLYEVKHLNLTLGNTSDRSRRVRGHTEIQCSSQLNLLTRTRVLSLCRDQSFPSLKWAASKRSIVGSVCSLTIDVSKIYQAEVGNIIVSVSTQFSVSQQDMISVGQFLKHRVSGRKDYIRKLKNWTHSMCKLEDQSVASPGFLWR